jgi:hypothetical protein
MRPRGNSRGELRIWSVLAESREKRLIELDLQLARQLLVAAELTVGTGRGRDGFQIRTRWSIQCGVYAADANRQRSGGAADRWQEHEEAAVGRHIVQLGTVLDGE